MQIPLELSFRNVEPDDRIRRLIDAKVNKLHRVCNYFTSCRVAIEKPNEHYQNGNPYRVRIEVKVPPGHDIIVIREPVDNDMHQPLEAVVRDAFESTHRRLKKLVELQRESGKTSQTRNITGLVGRLFSDEGYGFIRTPEGREIYFHRNSVLRGEFERLAIGSGVRFVEEEGEEGPQASTVQVIEKGVQPEL